MTAPPGGSTRKDSRRIWFKLGAVFGSGMILIFVWKQFTPSASYDGRSADDWLRQVAKYSPGRAGFDVAGVRAFEQMGASADGALIAGFRARDSAFHQFVNRVRWSPRGRLVFAKLPATAQSVISDYLQRGDTKSLTFASELVVRENNMRSIVPKLLPLLEDADSLRRAAILGAVLHGIGSDNVTAAQLRPLSTAAYDDMPQVRLRVALCLAEAGRRATNERPIILRLCADANASVRVAGAWALERVGGGPDDGTALETALAQWAESEGGPLMGWELYAENRELIMGRLTDSIVVACLSNTNPRVRRNAVLALERHFQAAKPAFPVITNLLDDPDALVRKHARALVESISGSGPER
jgi:hypothetical protein